MRDIDRLEVALLEIEVAIRNYLAPGPRNAEAALLRIIAAFQQQDIAAARQALLKRHWLHVVK